MTASLINYLPLGFFVLPLAAIVLNNLVSREQALKFCRPLALLISLGQMAITFYCISVLSQSNDAIINFSPFWSLANDPLGSYFSLDFLSALIALAISLVLFIVLLCYKQIPTEQTFSFINLSLILLLGMNGIIMVNDLFSLYLFIEITGTTSFILIAINHTKQGLEGAFKYLAISAVATALLLISSALIFMEVGSLQFAAIEQVLLNWKSSANFSYLLIAFVLFIAATSIKSGLFPFGGWLPDAYQSAPMAVSLLLGGIVTKVAGAYAIIRLLGDIIHAVLPLNIIFALLGLISIIYGAILAAIQGDFKRMLAYSSISQIGYIVLGAASGNILGLIGAAFHFFNHATFKTGLFLNAAAIEKQFATTEIKNLGGLQAKMPITSLSSIINFLSAAGIPPLAGFWSKVLIIIGTWQAGQGLFAGLATVAGILSCVYFLTLQRKVFFGKTADTCQNAVEVKGSLRFAQILLSLIGIGLGLCFPFILNHLAAIGLI